MKITAFWIGNSIVDFLKLQPLVLITVACFFVLDMGMESAYITFLIFPIGVLPFTYVTSFLFSSESSAQTFTMALNFFTIGVLSTVVFQMRL